MLKMFSHKCISYLNKNTSDMTEQNIFAKVTNVKSFSEYKELWNMHPDLSLLNKMPRSREVHNMLVYAFYNVQRS